MSCWLHPGVEVFRSPIEGRGLFAPNGIAVDTVVARLGGLLVSRAELVCRIREAERTAGAAYVDSISVEDGVDLILSGGQDLHF